MDGKDFILAEKDIYRLLNEVKLDLNEFTDAETPMPETLKKRLKQSLLPRAGSGRGRKRASKALFAAAVSLMLLIGAGMASPALAKNIPVVNSIFQVLNEKFGYHEGYIPYSQLVAKSVTDQGITLTINEALADDSKLIIGYTVKSAGKIKDLQGVTLIAFLKINGSSGGGGSGTGEYLDDTTFIGSEEINYDSPSFSDLLKVDLNVDELMGVKGRWDFSFTVSKAELVKKTTVFKPNNQMNLPEGPLTFDKVVFTPIDSTLYFSGNFSNQDTGANLMDKIAAYQWIVFDDQGTELIPRGGSLGGNSNLLFGRDFQGTAQFEKVSHIPQYLTVIPYRLPVTAAKKDPGQNLKEIDGNYPLELSQGKMGKLIIQGIETENGQTVIRYTAEGKAPYFQGERLYVKDAAGESVPPQSYDIRKDEGHPNDFTMVFPAFAQAKPYFVGTTQFTDIDFLDDLKFKITLQP
jgi:hypothetical protein